MATSTGTNTDIIIGTTQVSGTNYAVANKTTTGRHLRINGTSGLRSYAGTTGSMAYFYKVVVATSAYTITAKSNNTDYGTVELSGTTISASPAAGCRVSTTTPYEVTSGTATVTQNGNSFVVNASSDCTVTINFEAIPTISGYTVDFESDLNYYTDWTFTNAEQGTSAIEAHAGTYYATTGGKTTASFKTKEKYANPGDFTCYVSKTSTNTTSSTWYIQVSSDGTTWTDVKTQDATSMSKGEWVKFTADLSSYTNVYVRLYYSGSTAVRTVDDISITAATPKVLSSIAISGDYPTTFHFGDAFSYEGMTVTANYEGGKTADVTASATFTGYDMANSGTQTVTVSYTEGEVTKTATYTITVKAPATLTSITLSGTYPTEFQQGDAFSSEGIVVTANYDDETTADVTEDATFSGYDMSTLGDQTVTVTYNEQTATYTITVVEKKGTADNPYTVAEAIAYINTLGSSTSAEEVYVSGIISKVDSYNSTYSSITYWISDDGTTTSQMEVYSGKGLDGAAFSSKDDLQVGDVVTVKGYVKKYNSTPEFTQSNQLVSFERPVSTEPSITVDPATANVVAAGGDGTLDIAYSNIDVTDASDFDIQYYDESDNEIDDPDWILCVVENNAGSYQVSYTVDENTSEARTAYLKVYALGESDYVYSDLITITQAAPVVDYATLPFEYDGNATGTLPSGLTASGLDTYNSSPKMKFDGTGDYLVLKLNEAPGRIAFDIKGNGFSGGKFTVQTSADGVTYTDLETYTDLGTTQSESLLNNDATVRYIKWIYTTKDKGNVALGNIKVTKVVKKSIYAAGYATLYSEYPLDFTGSGLTAYIATMSGTTVSFTQVTTVPANTGLLLKGEAGEKSISVVAGDDVEDVSDNVLEGVLTDTEVAAGIFVLMKGTSGVGFYKTTQTFTVGANTAYLPASVANGRFIGFGGGETTDIDATLVNHEMKDKEVYDLQGRRVNSSLFTLHSSLKKGVYIVNGKKTVVK